MANFCTKCGKPLVDGQPCNCQKAVNAAQVPPTSAQQTPPPVQQQAGEWFNQTKNNFVAGSKNLFSQLFPILKSPNTTIPNNMNTNCTMLGVEMIVTEAVCSIIFVLFMYLKIRIAMGEYAKYVEFPLFRIIFFLVILLAGSAFLQALFYRIITRFLGGVTNYGKMLYSVGVGCLITAMGFLAASICMLIHPGFALIVLVLIAILGTLYQIIAFDCSNNLSGFKKMYAFITGNILTLMVVGFFAATAVSSVVSGFIKALFSGF